MSPPSLPPLSLLSRAPCMAQQVAVEARGEALGGVVRRVESDEGCQGSGMLVVYDHSFLLSPVLGASVSLPLALGLVPLWWALGFGLP